ncbi:hypothetical protein GCM10017744_054930 [Streptomyces antimycoticus]|uniref:Uncharacterized protein n=1 Tax=Streptomyces antimycoticus TaxID=68175 RepID=A0A4D4K439_9ACTN|nr:hypothetical protein SANT12839_047330 [Streptomyces antimycoticus]
MVDPVVAQRLLQRAGDMLLPDDLREGLGAVAAVQREGRHAYDDIGDDRQPDHARIPAPPAGAKRPPRTHQSPLTLAAFRPWGSSVR